MNELLLARLALALLESLIPAIAQRIKSGQISPEQQKIIHDRYAALRAAGDTAFSGPAWQIKK